MACFLRTSLRNAAIAVATFFTLLLPPAGRAANVPAGFVDELFVGGFESITAMAFAPDGRLFVCEQSGKLRVIKNGALLSAPFVSLSVVSSAERGLLGIAFDPQFSSNRYLYLYYTSSGTQRNRISRFRASASNPDVVESGSEQIILDVASAEGYHNGGALNFGTDGKLYVGVGDGHDSSNAQDLTSLQGKILRLNPAGFPNVIPADNPFVNSTSARKEIWSYGLRNPFTFGVDPVSGRIHINDVGQNTWEEINLGTAGANYGWPTCEGNCSNPAFVNPVHAYSHASACAITAGAFYRGSQFPAEYSGSYFFSDYCGGFIKRLRPDNTVANFATDSGATDIDVGPDGALYYSFFFEGEIRRIRTSSSPTTTTTTTSSTTTTLPNTVPVGKIDSPAVGSLYTAGTVLSFSGSGNDAEDGALPASAFTWRVLFHHDNHSHPAYGPISGTRNGSFTIPQNVETSSNVFFRIRLTVQDSRGLTHEVTRDVLPRKATLSFRTVPDGLDMTLDGAPTATPSNVVGVAGVNRSIGVSSPQTLSGKTFEFVSWSDGGAPTHQITTPSTNTTYTALFREVAGSTTTTSSSTTTTLPPKEEDETPPGISNVTGRITHNSAIIRWLTNESSDSGANYSRSGSQRRVYSPELVTEHRLELPRLRPGTTYRLRIRSADAAGNVAESKTFRFTTKKKPVRTSRTRIQQLR